MGKTTLFLVVHISNWSVFNNAERIGIKAIFYAPWSDSKNQHINTYALQMDRRKRD